MILSKIDSVFQKIEEGLMIFSWVATLFITFLIVIDIFLRFVLNKPLPATWEMSEVVMPYIVFFALAYTLEKDVHIRMNLVITRLPSKFRFACEIFSNIVSISICVMMTYWSWLLFRDSFLAGEDMLAAIKIPWWFGKLSMPVGMAAFSFRLIIKLIYLSHHHRTAV
jgi:TRAP-type C4-dicarboxylate transport system permease small subunit